jgi:hypothetical protein
MTVSAAPRGFGAGLAVTIAGAIMLVAGTLLPWIQATTSADPARQANTQLGLDFIDGQIFIFAAILTIVASGCGLAPRQLPASVVGQVGRLLGTGAGLAVLTGGYALVFGILNLRDVNNAVGGFNAQAGNLTSVGIGIYLDVAAGVVILAGAGAALLAARTSAERSRGGRLR